MRPAHRLDDINRNPAYRHIRYSGLDISSAYLETAKARHPRPNSYRWTCSNRTPVCPTTITSCSTACSTIAADRPRADAAGPAEADAVMYRHCRRGLAFNVMSKIVDGSVTISFTCRSTRWRICRQTPQPSLCRPARLSRVRVHDVCVSHTDLPVTGCRSRWPRSAELNSQPHERPGMAGRVRLYAPRVRGIVRGDRGTPRAAALRRERIRARDSGIGIPRRDGLLPVVRMPGLVRPSVGLGAAHSPAGIADPCHRPIRRVHRGDLRRRFDIVLPYKQHYVTDLRSRPNERCSERPTECREIADPRPGGGLSRAAPRCRKSGSAYTRTWLTDTASPA